MSANIETEARTTLEAVRLLRSMSKAPVLRTLLTEEFSRAIGLEGGELSALVEDSEISAHAVEPNRPRLPAFGGKILELRKRGLVPARAVRVCVDVWEWGKVFPRIVVPADMGPEAADFSILAGLDVIVAWSPLKSAFERVGKILSAIMRCRPSFLYVLNMDKPGDSFAVLSYKNGLELPEYAT